MPIRANQERGINGQIQSKFHNTVHHIQENTESVRGAEEIKVKTLANHTKQFETPENPTHHESQ